MEGTTQVQSNIITCLKYFKQSLLSLAVLENAGIAKGIFRQEIGFIYFSVKDDVFTFPLKRHVLSSIRKHKSLRGSILDTF